MNRFEETVAIRAILDAPWRQALVPKIAAAMSEERFQHVLGVELAALLLAEQNGVDLEQAALAALVHDYAKERPTAEMKAMIAEKNYDPAILPFGSAIWHGLVGVEFIRSELGVTDEEILQAVRVHTTGAAKMSELDKVLYVADYIEPGRDFPGVETARELAFQDLDGAVAYETEQTLQFLVKQKKKIYPKTIETYNAWVAQS